ncbi:MAG: response regulator transcription factor [Cyanobacteria bacterium SZAS LIN-3]|nr:response regulator transcription factor [Cyanobacteria bacterium SZAS LIN-3]
MRLLLVEDDEILSDGISKALRQAGYTVDQIAGGQDADTALSSNIFDLLILDLGLPKLDGLEVLRRLRARKQTLPVLILTARDRLEDRVMGLDFGADDYLTKPFDLPELEARIRAMIRRQMAAGEVEVSYGALKLDTVARRVTGRDEVIELSARELALLEVFMLRANNVVSKEQLIEHMYGFEEEVSHNAIEVNIHRLRKKIEPYNVSIKAIRGLGYLLSDT